MAIKGAVIGDILGSQYEFDRPRNLDWRNVPLISDLRMGFTDDSVMSLAIKKALDENLPFADTMVEIGKEYPNCGYGGRFYHWIYGQEHEPYESWGNGSAMRVSYVGEVFDDYGEMQKKAAESAAVSHNHPEGIKGAVVTAACVWMAKHGKSKQEIYDYVLAEYPSDQYEFGIDKDMEYLRRHYRWTEKCCDSVPPAMRCFYESSDYESFIRNVFSFACDSDTLGAIAGGVAEEFYHGFGNLPAEEILRRYLDQRLYGILFAWG